MSLLVGTLSVNSQLSFNAKDKVASMYIANRKLKYCQDVLGEVHRKGGYACCFLCVCVGGAAILLFLL